jgi:hypothetical protein
MGTKPFGEEILHLVRQAQQDIAAGKAPTKAVLGKRMINSR